ncbi:MAG TPA: hypothetical protein VJV79_06745 [Polyangiaceae bacterium]|nr:hypothetical protein [Polyangiaceae bacterium]
MKLGTLCLVVLCAAGCAKKESRPQRTEPWLAHPPARASANGDAALSLTRYRLDERSVIRFEIPGKRGALSGAFTRVSGELAVELSDLTHSRGWVRAELGSLSIRSAAGTEANDAALLERARSALELSPDANAPAVFASFELTSVEDALPAQVEPAPERAADTPSPTPFSRRAHFTALGNLLLHGFRVARRAPLSAEFGFADDRQVPRSLLIRSRSPFVVSLETHAIVALASESGSKGRPVAARQAREARVSVELYGTKID